MTIGDGWPDLDSEVQVPGSRPRVQHEKKPKPPPEEKPWDAFPKHYRINGQTREVFGIDALAKALTRSRHTIYLWEKNKVIPVTNLRAPWRSGPKTIRQHQGTTAQFLGRRLYPRAFIEGMIELAREYELLDPVLGDFRPIPAEFIEKAHELWKESYPV